MPLGRYRIKQPLIAVFYENGRHAGCTIPAGALIEIDSAVIDVQGLVNVTWMRKEVMMFAQDLRSHSERVEEPSRDR